MKNFTLFAVFCCVCSVFGVTVTFDATLKNSKVGDIRPFIRLEKNSSAVIEDYIIEINRK